MTCRTIGTILAGICVLNLACVELSMAKGVTLIPRITTAYTDYTLTIPGIQFGPLAFPESVNEVDFYMLGIGGSLIYDQFFIDIYAKQNVNSVSQRVAIPELGFFETFDVDRQALSMTVGIKVFDATRVYVGYLNAQVSSEGALNSSLDFNNDGFFAGIAHSWVMQHGVLSINVAGAQLDGELQTETFGNPLIGVDARSDTVGVRLGLSWSGRLSKNLGYALTLDGHQYTFENVIDKRLGELDSVEEEAYSVGLSMSYRFAL